MYEIQIRAIEKDGEGVRVPTELKSWKGLVNMPELKTISDVGNWLMENNLSVIESLGFQFRVVPIEMSEDKQ